ncbi:MAG: hypothetical protein ACRDYE_14840 [Acidimicrobiales bacterium]
MRPRLRWIYCCATPTLVGAILVACGSTSSGGEAATTSPRGTTLVSARHSKVFGIDVNTAQADIGLTKVPQVLNLIRQGGASAVRFGGNWNSAEQSPGVYDFDAIDHLLSLTRSDRLTLLFGLGDEPTWDATNGNQHAPPKDCDSPTATCSSVRAYVTALVRHAAPEGLRYIITRNEPQDVQTNWVGSDPSTFAHFQQVVYRAAHAADPPIHVLNGGTEFLSPSLVRLGKSLTPEAPYPANAVAFASALYRDPAWCDSIDVLDLHVGDHGPVYSSQMVDASEKAIKECNGGRHIPVWVTEVGYPSIASLQRLPFYQKELNGKYEGGESGQASFLTDTFTALEKNRNVVGVDWTFMIDPNTKPVSPQGATYDKLQGFGDGLAASSYAPKAAYTAFKDIAEG